MIFYVVYTATGFASIPIRWIKPIPALQISDVDTARQARDHNRESQRRIEVRYQGTGQQMSMKDRKELEALQREERTLTRRFRLAEESGNRRTWWEKFYSTLRPFKIAFGVILAVLTLLIAISMFLTLYAVCSAALTAVLTRSKTRSVDINADTFCRTHRCSIR
jgi:LMBR1 domain-containing protein 1